MAEIQVTDEKGNVHIFPDGSTPEMISKAMGLKSAAPKSLTGSPGIDAVAQAGMNAMANKRPSLSEDLMAEVGPGGGPKSFLSPLHALGMLAKHLGNAGTEQANDITRMGERGQISPTAAAILSYPGHALGTVGRIGEGAATPKGAILTAASMNPYTRLPAAAYGAVTGGKQMFDALHGPMTPDKLENLLLGGSAVAGSAALGKAGAPAAGALLKKGAGGINNAVMDASGRASQYGANPGLGMAAEGVTGFKPGTINDLISGKIAQRGKQLTDIYSSPQLKGTSVDLQGAVNDPFNRAISEATNPQTGMAPRALANRLVRGQQELTTQAGTGLPKNLSAVTPEDALQIKRNIADRTKFNKAEYSEGVNDVMRQAGGNVKDVLNKAVPEGAPLNSRLSDLYAAQDVAQPQAMNYKGGHVWANLPGNAVRGAGTNVASGMYKAGNILSPDTPLPIASLLQPRFIPTTMTPGTSPQPRALPAGTYTTPQSNAPRLNAHPVERLFGSKVFNEDFLAPKKPAIQLGSQMEPIENVGPMSQPAAKGLPSRGAGGRMQKTYTTSSTVQRPPVRTIEGGQIVEQPGGHAGGQALTPGQKMALQNAVRK